ncbi:MAG: SPOR domain-containing protein [Pseudomonadota bacterium]
MLTGIIIGTFVGLGIALGVALYIKQGPSPFVDKTKPAAQPTAGQKKTAAPDSTAADKAAKPADKPRFDFYTILPGTEEPVSEQELKQAGQQSAGGTGYQYFLQAGSFQTEAEADNLKAKLALLGVEAGIQTATLPDKGVWHRVRAGPYATLEELNRIRTTLSQNGISTSLIKIHE